MNYQYSEQVLSDYNTMGFAVLRNLIPTSLLADLRAQTDTARELARMKHGPSAQRLQPVYAWDELDHRPFRDFSALPELQATVLNVLGDQHKVSDIMGVLLEPSSEAWCTHWHRDWGYNAPHVKLDPFFEAAQNLAMFNQLNAALYDDHSLWVVPGSHNRRDNAQEQERFPVVPPPGVQLDRDMPPTLRENTCLAYARSMPGAINVQLFAGDVAFYRSCIWHIGNYVPYVKRATLHDGFYGPADLEWQATVRQWQRDATQA